MREHLAGRERGERRIDERAGLEIRMQWKRRTERRGASSEKQTSVRTRKKERTASERRESRSDVLTRLTLSAVSVRPAGETDSLTSVLFLSDLLIIFLDFHSVKKGAH